MICGTERAVAYAKKARETARITVPVCPRGAIADTRELAAAPFRLAIQSSITPILFLAGRLLCDGIPREGLLRYLHD